MKNNLHTELLAPAGDLQKAYIALDYGADAIFLGAKAYSLRAHASNFEFDDIDKIIKYAHAKNKKVYLVTNILCHNSLLNSAAEFIAKLASLNPDGFITADPFIVKILKDNHSDKEIHISTQQSICNSKSALFWKRNHASRIVLARELSIDEIKAINDNLNHQIELEVFIHGAVCISYSGRCMMSNNFSLRDANVGGCAQSCRWKYKIENNEIKNKSKYFTMSAKDMSQIEYLTELLNLNIASLKIEGRMKSIHYIATVVNSYRKAINDYINNGSINFIEYKNELDKAANRETDVALMDGKSDFKKMLYHDEENKLSQTFAFFVNKKISDNQYEVTIKNHLLKTDKLEIIGPNHINYCTNILSIHDLDNNELMYCPTPMQIVKLTFTQSLDLNKNDIGRIIR